VFILPVNDDGYIGRRAYILLGLVVLNALVLAATYVHPSNSDSVFLRYGFVPSHPRFSTLLSSMFLHAVLWHFAGNMFFLWMFGYRVENTFGRAGSFITHRSWRVGPTIPLSSQNCSRERGRLNNSRVSCRGDLDSFANSATNQEKSRFSWPQLCGVLGKLSELCSGYLGFSPRTRLSS
jgi:Rhomboid family